jgi:type VI secretion system protein ImpF
MAESLRFQTPLLNAFRDAYEKGENRRVERPPIGPAAMADPERETRRRGLSEAQVRQFVVEDLVSILTTIDLRSCTDLVGLDHARRSIVNYGLHDITQLTSDDAGVADIEQNIVEAILSYEPRISRDTIVVERRAPFNDVDQRLVLSIYAEISNRPMDIPIDFVAEIDFGSGKVDLRQTPGSP